MHVIVNSEKVFALLDVLVARQREKRYPYNRPDAIIPQTIIPADLRSDKRTLACWYLYACIYMRGGIESLQAFNALIKMWREAPQLFDPGYAAFLQPEDIRPILKKYIGWDSRQASINWTFNSRWLLQQWGGDPINLVRGVKTYDEAARRIRNKRNRGDLKEAGADGAGFLGFQHKMTSMLLYFSTGKDGSGPASSIPRRPTSTTFVLRSRTGA